MQKDRTEKNLEGFNDVFADIFNNLVLKAPLIKEEDLLPGPTESVFKADTNDSLTSDFKVVADFFAMRDKKNYKPSKQVLVHVEAVLHMLKTFTGDQRYQEIEKDIMSEAKKGSAITMCDFAERMEQKGIKEGIKEGIQLRTTQLNKLILSLAHAGRTNDIVRAAANPELQEKFMKEFGIEE